MSDKKSFYYKKSIAALEFHKVLEQLAGFAVIDATKDTVMALRPIYNKGCAKMLSDRVTQAKEMFYYNQRLPLDNLDGNIPLYIEKAAKGLSLLPREFLRIARLLNISYAVSDYFSGAKSEKALLSPYFDGLYTDRALYEEINRIFIDEERISDNASPALSAIRTKIAKAAEGVKRSLEKYIKRSEISPHLMEDIITMRYDRYVIPVRADNRGDIQGLIHDTSGSGATLFIEPLFVVEANNNIRRYETEERQEIERILAELCEKIAEVAFALKRSYNMLLAIDFIFAKARMSYSLDMCAPLFPDQKILSIKNARHPLIPKDIMVPLNIELGQENDTIIVTGPNTGGKTVFLKTLGLLCLMAKAGMHLPAHSASIFIFEKIYADIGDEQSIEQSLSTFSSHLRNIRNIIDSADDSSLVLFDEIGSGTDPVEGAALAISIIKKVRSQGAYTAVTTHYSELKMFALKQSGIINASFEFDLKSLSPTYRLHMGIPGKSYAFEISRHLGLQSDVIADAQAGIAGEVKRFDEVIDSLLQEKNAFENTKRDYEQRAAQLSAQQAELLVQKEKLLKNIDNDIELSKQKARRIVETAKRQADLFLQQLQDQQEQLDKGAYKKLKSNIKSGVTKLYDKAIDEVSVKKEIHYEKLKTAPMVGMKVFLAGIQKHGVIISLSGKNARVDCDGIVLSVSQSSLFTPNDQSPKQNKPPIAKAAVSGGELSFRAVKSELDIRGQNISEATEQIDKFLDEAFLSKLNRVIIIHGKGTGALRAGVRQYLKGHPHIKSYRQGEFGQGDSGVTVVELKD